MSQIEITDPSSELAQLAKAFPSKAKKPARVVEVLASVIDVDVDGPVLLELLASITKRLQNLRTFALDLSPSEVPDQLRKQIIGATDAFSRLLGPDLPLNFHPAAVRASADVTPFGAVSVPA